MNIGPATFAPARSLMDEEGIWFLHGDFSSFGSNLERDCSSDGWIGAACAHRGDGVIESVGTKYTMFLPTGTP